MYTNLNETRQREVEKSVAAMQLSNCMVKGRRNSGSWTIRIQLVVEDYCTLSKYVTHMRLS